MRVRLKLVHQGLLAVALPVLFQILSIFGLIYLTNSAQQQIISEAQSREIIASVDFLRREGAVAANLAFFYRIDPRADILARHDRAVKNIISSFKHLRRLLPKKKLSNMQKLIENGIKLDRLFLASPNLNVTVRDLVQGRFDNNSESFGNPRGPFNSVLNEETRNVALCQQERSKYRASIVVVLALGLAVNVAISLAVAVALRRSLASRFENVMKNALCLVDGTALSAPILSGDEVGELDRTLFETADELREIEEFRQQLVSMVSHELKTPLAAVQLVLEMIELGVHGPISDSQSQIVHNGHLEVDYLIALVNNLLVIENIESGNLKFSFAELQVIEVIDKVVSDYEAQLHRCELVVSASAQGSLLADKHHLSIALVNLIQQMSAGCAPDSKIKIEADRIDGQAVITLGLIPPQNLAYVTDLDLGLRWSCCRAILKLHQTRLDSVDDRTMQVVLPRPVQLSAHTDDGMRSVLRRTGLPLTRKKSGSLWGVCFVLVVVPLLFSVGFTIAFASILMQTEEVLARSFRCKDIIAHASALTTSIGTTVSSALLENKDVDAKKSGLQNCFIKTSEQVAALRKLLSDDPESLRLIDSFDQSGARLLPMVTELAKLPENSTIESWISSNYKVKSLAEGVLNVLSPIDQLVAREQERQAKASLLVEESPQMISHWLIGGCIVSILLSLALSLFLSAALTSKMTKLIDNARRLGRREQLLATLPGDNELAQLDQVLHLVVKAREEFAQFKSDLVVLVRGRISAPISRLHDALAALAADPRSADFSDRLRKQIQSSIANTSQVMRLVEDLLNVQVLESGKFNLLPVATTADELVSAAIRSVEALSKVRKVIIEKSCSGKDIQCDKDRVIQVLVNFLSNAIKFSEEGQVVKVESEQHDRQIEFRVIDQGRGMAPAFVGKLFQLYSQTERDDKEKRGGTGLGLYISKQIVEGHGGEIGVVSAEKQGSTFWFRLPVAPALCSSDRERP